MKDSKTLIDSLKVETGSVFTSAETYQNFSAKLTSGVSASVIVESSPDGSTAWDTLCTFTLDTVDEEITAGLVKVDDTYVRARVTALTGGTARVFAWMGS